MIDLHSHTTESDGSLEPAQLVAEAAAVGLTALSITDHDTLAGYDMAAANGIPDSLRLICGIELSTRLRGRSVHLLGYFPRGAGEGFRRWVEEQRVSRHDRNVRMIEKLRGLGIDITLEEVVAVGPKITARPHFAKVLIRKGYVTTVQEAFDVYLDRGKPGFVDRDEVDFAEGVRQIHLGGGISSIAHPARLTDDAAEVESWVEEMAAAGVRGIEVYHSDHSEADTMQYAELARRFGLIVTGGSDFHGEAKPKARLGCVAVPDELLTALTA